MASVRNFVDGSHEVGLHLAAAGHDVGDGVRRVEIPAVVGNEKPFTQARVVAVREVLAVQSGHLA